MPLFKNKKMPKYLKPANFVLILLILSLVFIGYLTLKDAFLPPETCLDKGLISLSEKKYKQAERLLTRAVSDTTETTALAAFALGNLYRRGGDNFSINGAKAELFLEKASSLNYAPAQYELALMYDVGDKIPENRNKAVAYMNKAAQNGYPAALYVLAVWAERGYLGTVEPGKIIALYEMAAMTGHENAMKSLIVLYDYESGFTPNPERVLYWKNKLENKGK